MRVKAIMTTVWDSDMEHEGALYKKGTIAIEEGKEYEVVEKKLIPNKGEHKFKDTDYTVKGDYYRYALKGLPGTTAAFAFIQITELTESYV